MSDPICPRHTQETARPWCLDCHAAGWIDAASIPVPEGDGAAKTRAAFLRAADEHAASAAEAPKGGAR